MCARVCSCALLCVCVFICERNEGERVSYVRKRERRTPVHSGGDSSHFCNHSEFAVLSRIFTLSCFKLQIIRICVP